MFTTVAGYLVADPEERVSPTGTKVFKFRMGTTDRGDKKQYLSCVIFNDAVGKAKEWLKKGTFILVAATQEPPNVYQSKDGETKVQINLVVHALKFLPRAQRDASPQENPPVSPCDARSALELSPVEEDYVELDLPF